MSGMAAANLTSTHPPITERIRILRTMAGGSFQDYDTAYMAVIQKGGVMPHSTMLVSDEVPLRSASKDTAVEAKEEMERARETSDTLWKLNKYKTVDCQCGTKFRIPPGFKAKQFTCPHCGRINQVP